MQTMEIYPQPRWKIVRGSKRTDYLPLALLVGIPAVYEPFNYIFIFGGFDSDFRTRSSFAEC